MRNKCHEESDMSAHARQSIKVLSCVWSFDPPQEPKEETKQAGVSPIYKRRAQGGKGTCLWSHRTSKGGKRT